MHKPSRLSGAAVLGGIGEDVVRKFYVDAAGNSYSTGYFTDSADFAISGTPHMLTSNGFFDVFVQKTGPDGNLLWAQPMGGASFDYGTGITADAQGNVYVTGVYEEAPISTPARVRPYCRPTERKTSFW